MRPEPSLSAEFLRGSTVSPSRSWPLKRGITNKEWLQIIKAMIVRRVPTRLPIPRDMLASFVLDDVKASLQRGIKFDGQVYVYKDVSYIFLKIGELVHARRLELKMMAQDEKGLAVLGVYRTERSQEIIDLLPVTLKAVLDYLPVTNLMAWMAYEAADAEEPEMKGRGK
jgi:hypothetical protein